jgi:FAD/FMN-containing dehydrogenase
MRGSKEPNKDADIASSNGKVIEDSAIKNSSSTWPVKFSHPGEKRYEAAHRLWNWRIDPQQPAMIVRCAAPNRVARSVDFARSNEMAVSIRAGGNSLSGDSFIDDLIVIGLPGMKRIEVGNTRCVACAEAGLSVSEFHLATKAFGLAA